MHGVGEEMKGKKRKTREEGRKIKKGRGQEKKIIPLST